MPFAQMCQDHTHKPALPSLYRSKRTFVFCFCWLKLDDSNVMMAQTSEESQLFCVRHAVCFSRLSARTCICNVCLQPRVTASACNYANKCRYIRLHHHALVFRFFVLNIYNNSVFLVFSNIRVQIYICDLECILWNFQNKTHSFLT